MRTDRLRRAWDIDVKWRAFPLHPDTPPRGRLLADLFGDRPGLQAAQARLRGLLAGEGLPVGPMERTFNTRLAQELAAWAETKPGGDAIHAALFRAVFVRGINLAEHDALVAIAQELGLPGDEARQVLASRRFADDVDADWDRARSLGITAVPTFVADHHGMVGAQPYEELEAFVRDLGAKPRARDAV